MAGNLSLNDLRVEAATVSLSWLIAIVSNYKTDYNIVRMITQGGC